MYPTVTDYRAIVSSKLSSFVLDDLLQKGSVEMQKNNPLFAKMYTGGFACVFKIKVVTKYYALRCWTGNPNNIEKRYYEISKYFELKNIPYFVDFKFIHAGILVNGKKLPFTRMDWIEGQNLKDYINQNINNSNKLNELAEKFRVMTKTLHENNISHGDLQPENIIIDKNQRLKLIDYDSLYVPNLSNEEDYVKGIQGFQHPNRKNNQKLNAKSDYFSELVIYLSLLALSAEPKLWDKFNLSDTETLLFTASDFKDLRKTKIYNSLIYTSPFVWYLTEKLCDFLEFTSLNKLNPLEKVISGFITYSPASNLKLLVNSNLQNQKISKLQSNLSTIEVKLNHQSKTLKTKELKIEELESKLNKKDSKGLAVAIPWLVSVVLGVIIISYLGSFNKYKVDASKVPGLIKNINVLETKLNQSDLEVRSLQNSISSINSKIDNIVFRTGLDYRNSNSSSFDKNWRLFFTTYESINLKKLNVCAKEKGKIRILLYDINGNLISRSNEFILNRGQNHWYTLEVNIPISKGSYFLTFEGNTSLKYDSNNLEYPYTIDNIIKITGSDNKLNRYKTSYYQYFYNWEFSLKTD